MFLEVCLLYKAKEKVYLPSVFGFFFYFTNEDASYKAKECWLVDTKVN